MTEPIPACGACLSLLWDKTFKQALSIPLPLDDNHKYTPKALVDRAAVNRYAVISGLKDLIDANEMVSWQILVATNHFILTGGCRTRVFPVFVMQKTSLMVIIKKGRTIFLRLWWRQWYRSTIKKCVVSEFKDFVMLLDSQNLRTSLISTVQEHIKLSETSFPCPQYEACSM
jgi:hypothetical protein